MYSTHSESKDYDSLVIFCQAFVPAAPGRPGGAARASRAKVAAQKQAGRLAMGLESGRSFSVFN